MIDCNTCHEPTPENAIMPETGDCVTCVRKKIKATESRAPSGQAELPCCKAERDFEMMLKRIVSAIKDKQSITYNELAIKAEDLLRRKGSKNTFLR